MAVKQIAITMDEAVLEQVEARAEERERSTIISRDLGRYYDSLRDARAHLCAKLSEPEISLILDACNGLFWDETSTRLIWAEVEDACRLNKLNEKWECDGAALVTKLRELTHIEMCALADACQRWWRRISAGEQTIEFSEALK